MTIRTLVPDIYQLVQRKDGWFTDDLAASFSTELATRLQGKFNEEKGPARLRMSKLGPTCPCALWHSIHAPGLAEPLPPWAEIKYSYGHMIEALAIVLARASGHQVEGEQDALVLDGITGHRDCVVDGHIVDVKSCSSRVFDKIRSHQIASDDSFGYLDQLDAYLVSSRDDALVTSKDVGYILAIDKVLGHIYLYEHRKREDRIRRRVAEYKDIVSLSTPPKCNCGTVEYGKSGNIALDTKASYSAFKYVCFPQLRTFLYASGPVYLTHVVRKPDVVEIDKFGKVVYN